MQSMRTRLRAAGAVAGAVLLAVSLAQPSLAQETPKEGGTLTVALPVDLRTPDVLQVRISYDKMVMGSTVYDSLFQTDERGNPVPALVTEATPAEGAREWTFKVREGVKFHNGKTFTAQDIKDNIDAYLDPEMASNMAGDLGNIESVEVTGEYEVKIRLKAADGELPSTFTDAIYMSDMDSYQPLARMQMLPGTGPTETADATTYKPIGTGPYKWVDRVSGDRITFERFEEHWRGRPPLDRVIFRVVPDPQVAALELQTGGLDVVPNYVSIDALPMLRAAENVEVYETPGGTVYQAFLNFEKDRRGGYKDFDAFRQGIAYLWNAQTLVPPVIGEFGILATQVIPPWQVGHDPSIEPWPYDPEKGKALLAEAGFEEGSEIFLLVWNRPYACNLGQAVASLLTEHGYKIKMQCFEPEAGYPTLIEYEWDLLLVFTSGRTTAQRMFYDRWRMSLVPNPPDDFYTMRDQELEDIIVAMGAETDREKYEELGKRANRLIVKDRIAMLPAYWDTVRVAANSRVKGIKVAPTAYYGFLMNMITTVWIDE